MAECYKCMPHWSCDDENKKCECAEKGKTMRKKLFELLCKGHIKYLFYDQIADYLIANGVTVQEWISVKNRLPENRDDVLVCRTWWNETRNPHIGWYNDVAQEWQILDSDGYYPCGKVTHWMPLPQPPKGENNNE